MILRHPRLLLACAAGALSLLATSACTPGDATKTAGSDAVAATVNGTQIKESRLALLLKQRGNHGQPVDPQERKAILENLAMQQLLADEAGKKGLDKSAEVLDQLELSRQAVLANAFVQDYVKSNAVGDEAIAAEYDKLKAEAAGNEYKAGHILVETEAQAKDIIAKLQKNPKAFADLAKQNSKDPGSKGNGGDLGWFDPQRMVPEFGAAVTKLGKGKFTEEPVKSQFGYHVILLEDARPKQIQLPTLDMLKPRLKQQVQQQNLKKLLDEMKSKAKIEIVEAAPAAAAGTDKPAEPAKH